VVASGKKLQRGRAPLTGDVIVRSGKIGFRVAMTSDLRNFGDSALNSGKGIEWTI